MVPIFCLTQAKVTSPAPKVFMTKHSLLKRTVYMDFKLYSLLSALFAIAMLSCSKRAAAWAPTATIQQRSRAGTFPSSLLSTPDATNPCWQDNYDSEDDCLSTIYSAAFVAEEWIKSMPCGKDADCLPENLSHPGTMGDSGVDKVDVMEYLNIRKAAPVSEKR